jgi:Pyruvate/2-oxoacid:ferredoxin oxidoreductase delta subunit
MMSWICLYGSVTGSRTPGVGPSLSDKAKYAEELKEQMRLNDAKKREDKMVRCRLCLLFISDACSNPVWRVAFFFCC